MGEGEGTEVTYPKVWFDKLFIIFPLLFHIISAMPMKVDVRSST